LPISDAFERSKPAIKSWAFEKEIVYFADLEEKHLP